MPKDLKEKIKFRTMWEPGDYTGMEKPSGKSMTDSSCYVPTEELIARFINPEALHAQIQYEDGDIEDIDDEQFQNLGEEEVKEQLKQTVQRIRKAKEDRIKNSVPLKDGVPKAPVKPHTAGAKPQAVPGRIIEPPEEQAAGEGTKPGASEENGE